MAEKRKRRNAKSRVGGVSPFTNLPRSKLDFQSTSPSPDDDEAQASVDQPKRFSDPNKAAEKAKALLQAQRDSVDMLTMVRERVEALPSNEILSALDSSGYFVVDNFLDNQDTLKKLEQEADSLYEQGAMEADVLNLGSGEYIVAIQGGQKQYTQCPRLVELVVSTTKHIPDALSKDGSSLLRLDAGACMATLRTFDRKSFQASLALLTGSEEVPEHIELRFGKIVTDDLADKRRLTMRYYLVPETWDEVSFGGGLVFENEEVVGAKRDRLVLWRSNSCSFKKEPWIGDDNHVYGHCMELHLVNKSD